MSPWTHPGSRCPAPQPSSLWMFWPISPDVSFSKSQVRWHRHPAPGGLSSGSAVQKPHHAASAWRTLLAMQLCPRTERSQRLHT